MALRFALLTLLVALGGVAARAADTDAPWTGEWRTSFSTLQLLQEGDRVTGTYGAQDEFQIEGKVLGDTCSFTYTEGQIVGKGEWVLQEGACCFKGKLIMANGRPRDWHGWRPDPKAENGKGTFGGMWLTNQGLMRLEQAGGKVEGRYGWHGNGTLEGRLKGRRLEFDFHVLRGGHGWVDMDESGKTFVGAAQTQGRHGWWEWVGRRASEYKHHVELEAGKIVGGATDEMLSYRIRAPDGYKPGDKKKWPCVLILHGMNMNAETYVNTLASVWKDIAKEYIILGINGEAPSRIGTSKPATGAPSKGADPAFNYTYVNWMGRSTYKGYPNTHRESPALVSTAMKELRAVYPISKYFVGGHSQGGYLTYVMLMHFPGQIAGAFPIAGAVIIQADPTVFDDDELRVQQRETPLVIVHSKSDPNVNFLSSVFAKERFEEQGWRAFDFLAPQQGGHMFGLLPVGQAIRWLEIMDADEPAKIHRFAEARIAEKAWADASSALRRAVAIEKDASARTKELLAQIDAEAKEDAAKFETLIAANEDSAWIDGFLEFRDQFQHAPCASKAMALFLKLREQHEGPAEEARIAARAAMRRGDRDGAYDKYEEVVDRYYASSRYRMMKRWLSDRK